MKRKNHCRVVATLAAFLPSTAFAQEQALPAVGNVNSKLSFGYDGSDGSNTSEGVFLNGAVSFPISTRLGAQLDVGTTDDSFGAGLHLFVRDPDSYLLGVYADRIEYDTSAGTAQNFRYGVEAEGYFGNITVAAFVGRDEVSGAAPSQSFDAAEFDIEYYLTENTALNFSAERAFDEDAASIGVTHLYGGSDAPVAVFGSVGTYDGDTTASIGVTVFFGNDGLSLKEIQRQNDPRVRLNSSPTRSGYFDALQAGTLDTTEAGEVEETPRQPACTKSCPV